MYGSTTSISSGALADGLARRRHHVVDVLAAAGKVHDGHDLDGRLAVGGERVQSLPGQAHELGVDANAGGRSPRPAGALAQLDHVVVGAVIGQVGGIDQTDHPPGNLCFGHDVHASPGRLGVICRGG